MQTIKHVSLFRNGRNQAIRIPREFELQGSEATIYREGEKLIIEPVQKQSLLDILSKMEPLDEAFPDVDSGTIALDDIEI
ncbi:hypothetical protein MNBD_GAMMA10-587 [hydrothermal vent metagenome]|uniref:SpoVT-AbrB domain-containing protein n=1 Tax=hydrothermal vent metagenome TaxID=652676 RepID=A0A3B0X2R4_9ZZZZ